MVFRNLIRATETLRRARLLLPPGQELEGRHSEVISIANPWKFTRSLRCLSTSSVGTESSTTNKPSKASKEGGESGGSDQPVTRLSLAFLMMAGGGLLFYQDRERKRQIEELKAALVTPKESPSAGTAAIGGPFQLVNHEGKRVTEKDFLGKWTLIYFGFTHCPDICPNELQKLCAAIDVIKKKSGEEVVPVFISVDPERDDVEQVHDYVQEFHPRLIGLTGAPEDVRKVASAYRVYYMKTEMEDSDYLFDHSVVLYLMNPNMEFTKFYGKKYDVDSLAEGVIKELKQYKK